MRVNLRTRCLWHDIAVTPDQSHVGMGEVSQLEPAHVIIEPTTWFFTGWSASAKEFAAGGRLQRASVRMKRRRNIDESREPHAHVPAAFAVQCRRHNICDHRISDVSQALSQYKGQSHISYE